MTTASEIGALVERARVDAGLSQRALADKAEISQPTLSRIISGGRTAKIPELLRIATATGLTLAQLSGVSTAAKRVQGTDSPRLSEMRRALVRFVEMDDYLDAQGIAPVLKATQIAVPALSCDGGERTEGLSEPEHMANSLRDALRLGMQPVGDLKSAVSQAMPIDVAIIDGRGAKHALSLTDPESGTSFVGVPATDDPLQQRTWLAHEVGHLLYGETERCDAAMEWNEEEQRAQKFARHLLVPLEGLRNFFEHREEKIADSADLSAVVQHFLVPPMMAAEALEEVGLTAPSTAHEWMNESPLHLAVKYGWSDTYHALRESALRTIAPQKLCARAIEGYREGVLTLRALATLRDTTEDLIAEELAEVKIFPAEREIAWDDIAELPPVDVDLDDLDRRLYGAEPAHDPAGGSGRE